MLIEKFCSFIKNILLIIPDESIGKLGDFGNF